MRRFDKRPVDIVGVAVVGIECCVTGSDDILPDDDDDFDPCGRFFGRYL